MREQQADSLPLSPKRTLRTLPHRILGKLFELSLTRFDVEVRSESLMMSEPPRADLLLIRRKGENWTQEQRAVLPDGIRDRNARYHLLECKFTESVNQWVIQRALGYDAFYFGTQRIRPTDLQTYVISAKTPDAQLLTRLAYEDRDAPGVYTTSLPILQRVVILVLNELRSEPHNEFVRLFASRQRVRQKTLDEVLQQPASTWPDTVWSLLFGLQKLYRMESDGMQQELTVEDIMEIGDKIRKQAIASATPEERLAGLAPEERLAGLAPEERLAGLAPEERLVGLTPEEMQILLLQIEAMLQKQQTNQSKAKPSHRPKKK